MSMSTPQTAAEWAAFRFPPRPTGGRAATAAAEEGESESGGGEDGGGEGWDESNMAFAPPKRAGWIYDPERRRVFHPQLRKQMALDRFDEALAVVRITAVFESHPGWDVEGFVAALEQAAQIHHGKTLMEVLRHHADGRPLAWPSLEPAPSAAPIRRRRP